MPDNLIIIGKVAMVHGINGLLKIQSFTESPHDLANYAELYIGNEKKGWQHYDVVRCHPHGRYLLLELSGLQDRTAAEAFKGLEIAVPEEALPAKNEDEYYWSELEGLTVVTTSGVLLGTIDYLFETGANDVMVVKGDRERYIPFLMGDVIKSIDLDQNQMIVEWDPEF
jgi:16S rRNA processing protein RimM